MKKAVITGITGQDGAYLSKLLLEKGYEVIGLTRSINSANTNKLEYLNIKNDIRMEEIDLTDLASVNKLISDYKPDEIYNFAAQSSVKMSFEQPITTIKFNVISVLNLLEAIKTVNPETKFYQASSSEMFGKVGNLPITEQTVIHPLSPYAISKASAHWTVINYRESYGIYTCCGILFNHESYLRTSGFFVKKIIQGAIEIHNRKEEVLRVGNLNVKRDFGYAPEYVKAIWMIMQQEKPEEFLICSGSSISLKEIVYYVFDKLNIDRSRIIEDKSLYRPTDIEDMYGDNSKAKKKLGWKYDYNFFEILDLLIQEELENIQSKSQLTGR